MPGLELSTSTVSTSMNFQKVLHKVVLVRNLISKFILVELTVYYASSTEFRIVQSFPGSQNCTKWGPPVFINGSGFG